MPETELNALKIQHIYILLILFPPNTPPDFSVTISPTPLLVSQMRKVPANFSLHPYEG